MRFSRWSRAYIAIAFLCSVASSAVGQFSHGTATGSKPSAPTKSAGETAIGGETPPNQGKAGPGINSTAPQASQAAPSTGNAPTAPQPQFAPSSVTGPTPPPQAKPGTITPSLVSSRGSGVAPLAVFFDASGTRAVGTSHPFHELEYRWDFGDPTSGNWSTTKLSKNTATGPVSAHVFEKPGTYTVTLNVFNGTGVVTTTTSIVVTDPHVVFSGANTICVAAAKLPIAGEGGCPAGADVKQTSDWATIVNNYAVPGKRVLLNRGEIYTATNTGFLNKTGPGIIGAYGTGAKPIIRTTISKGIYVFLRASGISDDWRVMDLDIDGESANNRNFVGGIGNYVISRLLLLRVDVHDVGGGVAFFVSRGIPAVPNQITLADSSIKRIKSEQGAGGMVEGLFLAGSHMAVLGNQIEDTTQGNAEHLIRIQYADRAVISHNQLQRSNVNKEMLSLRAPCSGDCEGRPVPEVFSDKNAAATKLVVISSNQFKINSYVAVQLDTAKGSQVQDVILERNWYQAQNTSADARVGKACLRILALRVTVRNEICDLTHATAPAAIAIFGKTTWIPAASSDVWIYNNTFYSGGSQAALAVAQINGDDVRNLSIKNNLAYFPNISNTSVTLGRGGVLGIFAVSGNSKGQRDDTGRLLSTNQIKEAFPQFTSRSPVAPDGFALRNGSYAVGAGVPVPVYSDFFGVARRGGTTPTIGATELAP